MSAVPARLVAVPAGANPMEIALSTLLRGPTSGETRAGYIAGFGAAAARAGFTVRAIDNGLVVVSFDSPAGRPLFDPHGNIAIHQLVRTLAQFPGVRSVAILIDGQNLCRVLGEC